MNRTDTKSTIRKGKHLNDIRSKIKNKYALNTVILFSLLWHISEDVFIITTILITNLRNYISETWF